MTIDYVYGKDLTVGKFYWFPDKGIKILCNNGHYIEETIIFITNNIKEDYGEAYDYYVNIGQGLENGVIIHFISKDFIGYFRLPKWLSHVVRFIEVK